MWMFDLLTSPSSTSRETGRSPSGTAHCWCRYTSARRADIDRRQANQGNHMGLPLRGNGNPGQTGCVAIKESKLVVYLGRYVIIRATK